MKLPIISGRQLVKAFSRLGYYVRSQKESHIHLRHPTRPPLTIPDHKELDRGTLKRILKDGDIDVKELLDLL
jgi:predicted RNA binding protein YcfA (HicA-like mRNA interferase family)